MPTSSLKTHKGFRPKLVLLDLDGTLFNKSLQILESSTAALAKLVGQDIPVCITTGRCWGGAKLATAQLPDNLVNLVSVHNGAAILNKDQVLHSLPLDRLAVRSLLSLAREHGVVYAAQNLEDTWVDSDPARFLDILTAHGMHPIRVNDLDEVDDELLKIAFFADQSTLDRFKTAFHEQGLDQAISLAQCGLNFADATAKLATKKHSGEWLAKYFGVAPSEVIAFGDHLNDLDMIQWAGRGVAMANGHPEVQSSADYVTLCHNSGGISHYLQSVLRLF